jgi:hypothetical protein
VLRKTDVDALSSADGFHLEYTRTGESNPAITLNASGVSNGIAPALETMQTCLDY